MFTHELSVGNWVKYNGSACKVYAISLPQPNRDERYNNKSVVTLWSNGLFDVTIDEIEGIEITREWLINNNFIKENTGEIIYIKESQGYEIIMYNVSNTIGKKWYVHIDNQDCESVANVDVQYIHELQRVLSMFDLFTQFNL